MDTNQKMRYSKDEVELITKTFGGDTRALYALRDLLWQFELTPEQTELLKFSDDVIKLLKKVLLPENNPDVPIFQQVSMYNSLMKIREYNPEPAVLHIKANDILIEYITAQFEKLTTGSTQSTLVLEDLPKPLGVDQDELRYVNMLAYHNIGAYIEGRIQELQILSTPVVEETPEEKAKREAANSTK